MKAGGAFGQMGWALMVLAMALGVVTAGCTPRAEKVSEEPLQLTVSIVPQRYFVERVGGERVAVNVMVEPGSSPATYEPRPEQLRALSDAAAYLSMGVPFEDAWLGRIASANRDMLMVDTAAGIERRSVVAHHDHEDEEEAGADHGAPEGALDPHIWVSPRLVKVQAENIYAALVQLDPEHEAEYKANLDAFVVDIEALEADIEATLAGLQSDEFMVFHPSWGYFAEDFGLEQVPIEVGGQEPSAQELAHLIERAREKDIRMVFAQPEFRTSDAETIANEIGGEVLLISPLAPDWLDNMRRVAQTFADVLE